MLLHISQPCRVKAAALAPKVTLARLPHSEASNQGLCVPVLGEGAGGSHDLSFSPQLWYFWRRRLFIWISFMESYFEILLYVVPLPSSPLSRA